MLVCLLCGVSPLSVINTLISSSLILNSNSLMSRSCSTKLNYWVERLSQSVRGRESHPLAANEFSSCGLLLVSKHVNLLKQFLHYCQLLQKESGNVHTAGSLLQLYLVAAFIVLPLPVRYCFLNRLDPPCRFLVG